MKIGVVGGGVSGVYLSYLLAKKGHDVFLFERDKVLGGLAASFEISPNTFIDRYYHFICAEDVSYRRILTELGLGGKIRKKLTNMAYFYDGNYYPFSTPLDVLRFPLISLKDRIHYSRGMLKLRATKEWKPLDEKPGVAWLRGEVGGTAYDTFWKPLLLGKFNHFYEQASASWVWARINRVSTSRVLGGWREEMGWLDGGTRSFVACLEEKLRALKANIYTDCGVQEIIVENKRVKKIKTKNEEISVDAGVSTVPAPLLLKMMPELSRAFPDYHARLSKINYIGVMCCLLLTESPLTNNFWLNVVDKRIPFVVTVEYTNLDARKDLDGSLIYLPHYVPADSLLYSVTENDFDRDYPAYLRLLKPDFHPSWLKKRFIFRSPYAQPVCTTGFLNIVPPHETPLENFYVIESTQLYPNDRTISGSLELSEKVAGYF